MDDSLPDSLDLLPSSENGAGQPTNGISSSGTHPSAPRPKVTARSGREIYLLAKRLLGSRNEAAEVTRAVLVMMLGSRGSGATFWPKKTTARTVRRDDPSPCESSPDLFHPERTPPITAAELMSLFEQAVQRLPDIYRAVFVLADIEGVSIDKTAILLSMALSVAKLRLHRARLLVQDGLAPHLFAWDGTMLPESKTARGQAGDTWPNV
jgi:DNA-directed RNA polymerase specialized sigma24 family protein